MGNFRCYNCNREFWREKSLKKHFFVDCPAITEEMKLEALKPFYRIVMRLEHVIPGIEEDKEIFKESRMIRTNYGYDPKERLLEVAKDVGLWLDKQPMLEQVK